MKITVCGWTMMTTTLLRSSQAFVVGTAFGNAGRSAAGAAASGASASATTTAATQRHLFNRLFGSAGSSTQYPITASEDVMSQKAHGTSEKPVQEKLRWNCDFQTADRICNFNRHYAEFAGYWQNTDFVKYAKEHAQKTSEPIEFYDSVTGTLLFRAPVGRSMDDFLKESASHGWPSFRDEETNWEHVRCLKDGECVSTTGTHLGHNLPDRSGNRYCINLVSVAGQPEE